MKSAEIADYVQDCLEAASKVWVYRGPPRKEAPHALLTSGQHSDGYADVGGYIKDNPARRREFATYLLELIPLQFRFSFSYVGGADTSSTLLAADVADLSQTTHICMIKAGKLQVWHPHNPKIKDRETVLEVEELITKSTSALAFREGIWTAHPGTVVNFVPFLPTIVDRSDSDSPVEMVKNSKILSLVRLPIRNYDLAECPYCKVGSMAIKPKEGDNWKLLNAHAA